MTIIPGYVITMFFIHMMVEYFIIVYLEKVFVQHYYDINK